MKIPVRDATEGALGAIQVKIKDLGGELEKITVRVRRFALPVRKKPEPKHRSTQTPHGWPQLFARLLSSAHAAPAQPQATAGGTTKTIEIKLSLPELPKLPSYKEAAKTLLKLARKYPRKTAVLCVAIVIVTSGFVLLTGRNGSGTTSGTQAQGPPQLTKGTPDYPTILPAGKPIDSLGGWTRISPPDRNPVYTYVDKIGDVKINVSEQPLPANLQRDTTNQIVKLANNFGPTNKITAGDTTAYISIPEIGSSQSVVFAKADLLILIRSSSYIPDNQWATYIDSMR